MPAHDHCHCRDYTRSQLMKGAAAQAGKGLPAIETGMPAPAGTGLSRRSFMLRSAGLALSVYGASKLPLRAFEEGIANAATPPRVLVSLFFDGGIDSLNVLAPIDNPTYHDLRPTLALSSGTLIEPDSDPNTRLYWHPSAAKLATLYGEDKVSVFPAIGYDSPNQSHFTSRHYYEIGDVNVGYNTGWLGRYIDRVGADDNPLQGLALGYELSPSLATATMPVAAVDSVTDYDLWSHVDSDPVQARMYDSFGRMGSLSPTPVSDSPSTIQARKAMQQTEQLREQLANFNNISSTITYPNTYLGRQLKSLAAMLAAGLPIQVVTLSATGGYDTHSSQAATLDGNLASTCDAIFAFQRDLEARALDDRVLLEAWSEFGRRPEENADGTDHGAAGLAFVIGKHAGGGMVGNFPGLATLDPQDNLLHTTDFQAMYCTLFEDWLQTDPTGLIPDEGSVGRYTGLIV